MKCEKGNVSRKILASLLLVAVVAAFFYGRILLAAPPVPVVAITVPSNGDAISGIIAVDADYSINAGNIHSLYLSVDGVQVDSVEVHARTGSYSFSLDASSLDDGFHEIAVEAYTAAKPSGHFSDNSITVNVVTPACSSDVDCDDSDNYTEDVCSDPGLVTAACSNQHIACLTAGDCEDSDSYTEDICEDGGTSAASCVHNAISCLSDADCDDGNALTLDGCANSGSTNSSCSNDAIVCNNDSDCDDTNAYTINSCINGGTVMAACESKAVACLTAANCDDADNYTVDNCDNAGTEAASCAHSAIACLSAADCDDSNDITTDTCESAGTADSACAHVACDVACAADSDCDDGNALTNDTCANAGTCEAGCENAPCDYECASAADCDDANDETEDECAGAGACGATCEHTQIVVEEPVVESPVVEEPVAEEPVVETPEPPVVEEPVVEKPVVEPDVITPEPPVAEEPPAQPLTLNILAPANGTLTNKGMVTITGTTLAGATVEVGDATVTAGGAGAFSAIVSLIEGNNTIYISAANDTETITETLEVTSDTIPPSVLSVSPLDGADLQEAPTTILARISDNPGGSGIVAISVKMELNGADAGCVYDAVAGTCAATGLSIGNGAQTLVITAADAAGNVMAETTSFVVAGKGPRVKIVKVPGRTLQSSTGLAITDANQAITEIISTDNVTTEVASSSSVQTTSQQETGATTTGNAFIDALKSKRHTFNEMKKRLTPKSPGWKLFGDAAKDANGNENAVIETPDLSALANSQTSALPELTLSGEIDATVEGTGAAIDPSTIEVTLNGKKIGHTFDPTTKKVKCSVKDLKRGTYEVTVTVLDVTGNMGSATTAFGVDPIITSITLENISRPGSGEISVGERFLATVDMIKTDGSGDPETGFSGAWIALYNADIAASGGEGSGSQNDWIGGPYYLLESATVPGRYLAEGYIYTTVDGNNNLASSIRAAVPLFPNLLSYRFSDESLMFYPVLDPWFEDPVLVNSLNPGTKTINIGDSFTISQMASPGIQNMKYQLLDVDAIANGEAFNQASVMGGDMPETSFGSGEYAMSDPASIYSFDTPAGTTARVVIGVAYPEYATNYARGTNVLYVGPGDAPAFTNFSLSNRDNPGEPIIPGTGVGSWYSIQFEATGAPQHVPYYKVVLANADKIMSGQTSAFASGAILPYTLKTTEEGGGIVSLADGRTFLAEGTLDYAVDMDGDPVTNIVALVTAAEWFDIEQSNNMSALETMPEPSIYIDQVRISNVTSPLGMTVVAGDVVRFEAWGPEGLSLTCEMFEALVTNNVPDALFVLSAPMNEIEAGHYVCDGDVLRLNINGNPAEILMASAHDSDGNVQTDSALFLTFRDDNHGLLSEVHISNVSRPGAEGIAIGETFEITAKGQPGLTNLSVALIDVGFKNDGKPFNPVDGAMEETEPGSYLIRGTMLAPPVESHEIRGVALDVNGDVFNVLPVLSTEVLKIEEAPAPNAPVIYMIDGQDATGGTVTSHETSPLVEGTADPNATVNIYEFVEGASSELTAVNPAIQPYAIYNPVTGAYAINAPVLSMTDENGDTIEYGTGGAGYVSPCSTDGPTGFPGEDACTTGEKDIRVYLTTLYDVLIDPNSPRISILRATLYSAGDPSSLEQNQDDYMRMVLESMLSQGMISSYSIDASALAFKSGGTVGGDYEPINPMTIQQMICMEVPGDDGSLIWDGSQYIGSKTPLQYNGVSYGDMVVFGIDNGSPNVISGATPIPWAGPGINIDAALVSFDQGGMVYITGYATPDQFAAAGISSVTDVYISDALIAPTATDTFRDYRWNSDAFPEGVTVAPVTVCKQGLYNLLATTTAGPDGAYSAVIGPFEPESSHTIAARASNDVGASPYSSPVTYNVGTPVPVDTTPPVIYSYSLSESVVTPGVNETVISAGITDESDVSWSVSIIEASNPSNIVCSFSGAGYVINQAWGGEYCGISTSSGYAPDGGYIVFLRVVDAGDYASQEFLSVTVDNPPQDNENPVITYNGSLNDVISPTNPTSVGYKDSYDILADIADDSLPIYWRASIYDTSYSPAKEIWSLMESGNSVDKQWNGIDEITENVAEDGTYYGELVAYDAYENSSRTNFIVIVDDTSPSVSVDIAQDEGETLSGEITVEMYVADNANGTGVSEYTAQLDGTPIGVYGSSSPYTSTIDTKQLENGQHSLTAYVKDFGGNYASSTVDFEVYNDKTPPVIESVYPLDGASVNDASGVATVRIYDEGGSGLYSVAAIPPGYSASVVADPSGADLFNVTINPPAAPATISKTMRIILDATDAEGNATSTQIQWYVDLDGPVIELDDSQSVFNSPDVTAVFSISDSVLTGVSSSSIYVSLDDTWPVEYQYEDTSVYNGTLTVNTLESLPSGMYTLVVEVTDNAGNVSHQEWTINVDVTPPVGDMSPEALPNVYESGEYSYDSTIYFRFKKIADNAGGSGIKAYYAEIYDGTPIDEKVGTFAGNMGFDTDSVSVDGLATYCVVAEDYAGNRTEPPQCDTIMVNTGKPGISSISATPSFISPKNVTDGVNTNDKATITANVEWSDENVDWNVKISHLTLTGTLPNITDTIVAILPLSGPGEGLAVSAVWDGKDYVATDTTMPEYVDDGPYNFKIIAKTKDSGEESLPGLGTIMVDNTYPLFPDPVFGNIVDGQNIKETSYQVQISAYDASGIESLKFCVDAVCYDVAEFATSGTSVSTTYDWAVSQETAGQHALTVEATDAAKNTKKSDPVFIYKGEQPVPEVKISSPSKGEKLKGVFETQISYGVVQGKVKYLELYISNDGFNYSLVDRHNFASPFSSLGSYAFSVDSISKNLADGIYFLKARAYKTEVLYAESLNVKVTIDNAAPSISIMQPVDKSIIDLSSGPETTEVDILAKISDDGGSKIDVSSIKLSLNGEVGTSTVHVTSALDYALIARPNLSVGEYVAAITAKDNSGNETTAQWEFSVQPRPKIASICPISGTATATITLTVDNLPSNPEYYDVYLYHPDYASPMNANVRENVQIISITEDAITLNIPENIPASDIWNGKELPYFLIEYSGRIQGTTSISNKKHFQVLETPIDQTNLMYVMNVGSRDISVVDLTSEKTVAVIGAEQGLITGNYYAHAGGLTDVIYGKDGSYVYALNGGSGLSDANRKLNVIDSTCNNVVVTVDGISGDRILMSSDGEGLYVNDFLHERAYHLKTDDFAIESFPFTLGLDPIFAMDANNIFAINNAYAGGHVMIDSLELVDDPYNSFIKRFPAISQDYAEISIKAFDATPDGRYVVGAWEDNYIRIFNLDNSVLSRTYGFDNSGVDELKIDPTGKYLYVLSSSTLSILDLDVLLRDANGYGEEVVLSEDIDGGASHLMFSNDGAFVYLTLRDSNITSSAAGGDRNYDSLIVLDSIASIEERSLIQANTLLTRDIPSKTTIISPATPHIDSLQPDSGYVGDTVIISGTGFDVVADNNIVTVGGARAIVTQASENELYVKIPVQVSSAGVTTVTNHRQISNALSLNVLPPAITEISPSNEVTIGMSIMLKGAGFGDDPDDIDVYFNDVSAEITSMSPEAITLLAPPLTTSGNIHVKIGALESNTLSYTVIAPDIHIDNYSDGDVVDISNDSDNNFANGLQLNMTVATSLIDNEIVKIQVNNEPPISGKVFQGDVLFENITVLPDVSTIKAFYLNTFNGTYAEDEIALNVNMPNFSEEKIVYSKVVGPESKTQLYIYDIIQGSRAPLPNTLNGSMPSWKSSGESIAYTQYQDGCAFMCVGFLYVVNAASGETASLVEPGGGSIIGTSSSWSPDGSKIAYFHDSISLGLYQKSVLSVIEVNENNEVVGDPTIIDDEVIHNGQPKAIWSPNSKYLIFPPSMGINRNNLSIARFEESSDEIELSDSGVPSMLIQDWIQGTDSVMSSGLLFLYYASTASAIPVPVYLPYVANTINAASMSDKIDEIAYVENNNQLHLSGDLFITNISSFRRDFVDSNVTGLDWLTPEMPIYNSVPPSITDLYPSDGSYVNTIAPVISATIKDDLPYGSCDVDSINLVVDGIDVSEDASYNRKTGKFTYKTSPQFTFTELEEVSYSINATDCVGNETTTITGTFTINDPPVIESVTPMENAFLNSELINISAIIRDTHGIAKDSVRILINGKSYPAVPDIVTGVVSLDLDLDEGLYEIEIQGTDIHHYISRVTTTFYIDRTTPELMSKSPESGYYNYSPDEISFVMNDNTGFDINSEDNKIVLINFQAEPTLLPTLVEDISEYGDGTLIKISFAPPEGFFNREKYYLFYPKSKDKAGNIYKGNSYGLYIGYDITPPSITFQIPLQNQATDIQTIKASISDNLSEINEYLLGVSITGSNGTQIFYNKDNGVDFKAGILELSPILQVDVPYHVQIFAVDSAGNASSASRDFTYSETPGEFTTISSFSIDHNVIDNPGSEISTIEFTLSGKADVNLKAFSLNNGDEVGEYLYSYPSEGTYSVQWDPSTVTSQSSTSSYDVYYFEADAIHPDSGTIYSYSPKKPENPELSITDDNSSISPQMNQYQIVDYSIEQTSLATLIISDENYSLIAVPFVNQIRKPGTYTEVWNGRDNNGKAYSAEIPFSVNVVVSPLPENAIAVSRELPEITIHAGGLITLNSTIGEHFTSSVSISRPSFVNVFVIDEDGESVELIMNDEYVSEPEFVLDIPLDDNKYTSGVYTLLVNARDVDGRIAETKSVNFIAIETKITVNGKTLTISAPPSYNLLSVTQNGATELTDILHDDNSLYFNVRIKNLLPGLHSFEAMFEDETTSEIVTVTKQLKILEPLSISLSANTLSISQSEVINISYNLSIDDKVSAAILRKHEDGTPVEINNAENLIKILCDECDTQAGVNSFVWDGTNSGGQMATPGEYMVIIYAFTPGDAYRSLAIQTEDITVE